MRVLCFDVGSSSLKFALYNLVDGVAGIEAEGNVTHEEAGNVKPGLEKVFKGTTRLADCPLDAIGHRIVFGGQHYEAPVLVNDRVMLDLESLVGFDPLHMPPQVEVVREVGKRYPGVAQVLCFDTSFHRRMPQSARSLPLPRSLGPEIQRYGFHGLSYEYVVSTVEDAGCGKVVIAHLGSGASMCALQDGNPMDTTMGFSPLGGLMMGTRPGDLDPGVGLYLVRQGWSATELSELLYRRSGLLGVSETTPGVRELLERAAADSRAAFALELFVYQARKQLGAMIAVLGGLDELVFTGGIGEGSPDMRVRICEPFAFASVAIDQSRNAENAPTISTDSSRTRVRVVHTNENLMIARHVVEVLNDHDGGALGS